MLPGPLTVQRGKLRHREKVTPANVTQGGRQWPGGDWKSHVLTQVRLCMHVCTYVCARWHIGLEQMGTGDTCPACEVGV